MHEVLVKRFGGLSLPRKSVVRLTDRPDMTLDVYRGRKTTMQQQQPNAFSEVHEETTMDRYIRDCAMDGHVLSGTSCKMTQNDRTCYCDHRDGCNQNHEM